MFALSYLSWLSGCQVLEPLIRMAEQTTCQPNTVGFNQTTCTSSDEHVDPYCELCVTDKKRRIAAVGLCKECNTFVCQQCLDSHSRWHGMRNHTILQGDEMPRTQAEKPAKFPDCEVHKEYVKDQFCLDHGKILCSRCISFHGTCKLTTINELCNNLDKFDVKQFRDAMQKSVQTANTN